MTDADSLERARHFQYSLHRHLDAAAAQVRALHNYRDLYSDVRRLASDLDVTRNLAYVLDLNLDLDLAPHVAHDVTLALRKVRTRARAFDRARTRALDRALTRGAEDGYGYIDTGRQYVVDLVESVGDATQTVVQLQDAITIAAKMASGTPRAETMPARWVARWVSGASAIVPVRERALYREVFDTELRELAATRASRWAQLVYALNLTVRMWSLRQALASPAPERSR